MTPYANAAICRLYQKNLPHTAQRGRECSGRSDYLVGMVTSTIFLYEYVTGGGSLGASSVSAPAESWLREGGAMIAALAADFLARPQTRVVLLRDARLRQLPPPAGCPAECLVEVSDAESEARMLRRLAQDADWTVLIAPESERALLDRCRAVEAVGGRLLSPHSGFVAETTDKHRCAQRLRAAGISTPRGIQLRPGARLPRDFSYPAVIKPCDGAGSQGVQWLADARADYDASELGTTARLERFQAGMAASVAVLCGPRQILPLPACRQRLTDDGRFGYLGGEAPLPGMLALRAQRLALAAVNALPATLGYVGVDLVLGASPEGRNDVVIEVNPRLTTSYVGLRHLTTSNLAVAMLAIAEGQPTELSWAGHTVQFEADGRVAILGATA
jgi:predicted ATP-grasp superfamily ATP-dependent carboligase